MLGSNSPIADIAYDNSMFVAAGGRYRGIITYSNDGVTWVVDRIFQSYETIHCIAYGNGRFIIGGGGTHGSGGRIAYSNKYD
jgi:hypothetical protein